MEKPLDLLQGTLDMLILKAISLSPCMATAFCCASSRFRKSDWRSSRGRCIPRFIVWSITDGSRARGENRRTIGALVITA